MIFLVLVWKLGFFALAASTVSLATPGPHRPNAKPVVLVHAGPEPDDDYSHELLKLALNHSETQYRLQALGYWPPRGRDFAMMESQDGIDVMWGSARQDREDRFLTIRIPIFKGLMGWRIALVHERNRNLFKDVADLSSLSHFRPGQYFSWTDTRILKHNGINVFEAHSRANLMDMLVSDKFDYFPRATIEIMHEFEQHKHQGVEIDPHILIIYPTAFYYYVHKDNQLLANDIKSGLETLIANGEMDRLFFTYFGDVLTALNITGRKVIKLDNPFLPEKAPFDRKALWLQSGQVKSLISD